MGSLDDRYNDIEGGADFWRVGATYICKKLHNTYYAILNYLIYKGFINYKRLCNYFLQYQIKKNSSLGVRASSTKVYLR